MFKADIETVLGEISDLHPIAQGEDSKTYSFHQKGNGYILRINRSAAGFEKDAFVSRNFATPFLPIPEIISVGTFPNGDAYCISRRAEGVTLQDLSPLELPPVLPPISWVMKAIAASNVSATIGFGPFDSTGTGRNASWRDFILEPQQYASTSTRPYLDRIERWIENCPETRQLVHGDFGSNNVLTHAGRITGVIDWSEALFGDPLYDVANILFWRPWLDCMEQQARYFESQEPELLEDRERLVCYQLKIGLNEINQGTIDNDTQNVTWASARCDELLRRS